MMSIARPRRNVTPKMVRIMNRQLELFNNYSQDPRHPQRIAKCQVTVVDEDSTDLTFYFNGQRRNSAADLFCESANNKTICEVSLTVTEMITRDMHGEEIKCVYADEREEIEKGRRELLKL